MTYLVYLLYTLVKSARFLLLYPIHMGRAYIQSDLRAIVLNTDILVKIRDFFFRISFTLTLMEPTLRFELRTYALQVRCAANYAMPAYILFYFIIWNSPILFIPSYKSFLTIRAIDTKPYFIFRISSSCHIFFFKNPNTTANRTIQFITFFTMLNYMNHYYLLLAQAEGLEPPKAIKPRQF